MALIFQQTVPYSPVFFLCPVFYNAFAKAVEINCAIASNNALLQPSLEQNEYLHLELFLVNVSCRLFYSALHGEGTHQEKVHM